MEKTPLNFVWHYVKIFRWYVLSMFILLVLGQTSGQFFPYYMAKIFDAVAGRRYDSELWRTIITYVWIGFSLMAIKVLLIETTMFISTRFFPQVRTMVIRDSFDYVNKHSIAYFNQEMSGNISNKVQQLDSGVKEFFDSLMNASFNIVYVTINLVVLSYISLYFMLALSVWLIAVLVAGIKLGKLRSGLSKISSRQQSTANAMIVDSLANYSEIKSFANFKFERLNLLKYLRLLRKAETKEQKVRVWIHFLQNIIMILSMLVFLFISIWILKRNLIDSTQFIYANTLFAMISEYVFAISWIYNNLARAHGQMNSALETIAVEPGLTDKPDAKELVAKKAAVSFEGVNFAYNGKKKIFNNLNIEIKAGEKIGLVGTSGAGKSTFVKLLSRYYDIDSGAIKINGIDIRDLKQDSLHKNIATIPQDVCLFNRTLYDNIRYGRTNAEEAEVFAAAKKASADNFIRAFPAGYQTKVGERGVVLSGGERQRIAIARAILKNAPILIFDEATSALDSESEKHIQKSLIHVMKNKTVIAVAHRLSTLREMDRILVFDKGTVIEQGTHESLLRKKGVYAKLYKMQADGFVGTGN